MVQDKQEDTNEVKTTYIKAEDIAVAAIVSAIGAATPELLRNQTARWVCCVGIGLCIGIYGANIAIDLIKKEGDNDGKHSNGKSQ